MSLSRLKYLYLAYFSKPASDRFLYRDVRKRRVGKILQIGLPTTTRALRLISATRLHAQPDAVRFAAIDLFEARGSDQPGLALKEAFRQLKPTGASVQLIPGDPQSALARSANALGQMDLVLISADFDETSVAGGWYYLPRLVHARTRIFQETRSAERAEGSWREVAASQVEALARTHRPRRAA